MVSQDSARISRLALTETLLDGAWDTALHLAWEGLLAQTTPVGSAVVDGGGNVIAAGRGRRYELTGPTGQLSGSHVAHAEVNALAQLASGRDWEEAYLLTTLEPCGMCHGAAIQSTVGGVFFAGRDPYAGTGGLRFNTPQAQRRELLVEGPLPDVRGALAELMHIAFLMRRESAAHVLRTHDVAMPRLTAYARQNHENLRDAIGYSDYQRAVEIARAAPRDR